MKILMVGTVRTKKSGGMTNHTEELIKELRRQGQTVEHFKLSSKKELPNLIGKTIIIYKKTIGLSIKLIKDYKKYDIVHIQSSGPLLGFIHAFVGALWKKTNGPPLFVTFHYRPDKRFLIRYHKMINFTISRVDYIFVVSNKQKDNLKQLFRIPTSTEISTIHNGFDEKEFKPISIEKARSKLNLPQDKKIILNIGHLLPVKGLDYLIESVKNISMKRKNILCIIIGHGSLKKDLEKQIKKHCLEDYIKLVGPKPHDEIPLWLNACNIFVLSSLWEGNPTVMFEALGCAKPFVGTNVGGIPEIIISEDLGLLCEPANFKDLTEKILIALDKKWEHKKIMKYGEQFTWANISKETIKAYEKILSNK